MTHESTNLWDEMKQIRYGKLCVLRASQNKSGQTASLWPCWTKKKRKGHFRPVSLRL